MDQQHHHSCQEDATASLLPGRLKKFLSKYYRCTMKSVLTGCITTWYGNCSIHVRKALQWVVKTAQYITGTVFPPIQDIHSKRCLRKSGSIIKDPIHPSLELFSPLQSGRRYRSMRSDTKRLNI